MLRVENLVKYYGDFKALDGISFKLKRGERLGLIGENGAGKTTTIRILVGLLKPSSGFIEYDGLDLFSNLNKIRKKIGYVPEVDNLYNDMGVKEYLKFFASLYNVKDCDKIDELMQILKIPNKLISELSKGMKRRVAIARSLLHDPDYLIYDEPIGGLDPVASLFISKFIGDRLKDKAVLFSAHNLYYIETTCSKVAIMKDGKIIYYGKTDEISGIRNYKLKYIENGKMHFFETNDVDELSRMIEEIALSSNAKILDVNVETRRLEDVYFELLRR